MLPRALRGCFCWAWNTCKSWAVHGTKIRVTWLAISRLSWKFRNKWSKNNLRGVALGTRPKWRIKSLIPHPLLKERKRDRMLESEEAGFKFYLSFSILSKLSQESFGKYWKTWATLLRLQREKKKKKTTDTVAWHVRLYYFYSDITVLYLSLNTILLIKSHGWR